jgi:Mn2+/Fe2+ NRAMP family transporter
MKTIGFLYEIIGREMIFGTIYSIIPSIILAMVFFSIGFVLGFPIGLMIGVTLGAINGVILGILCLLFINRLKNPRMIKDIFAGVSVIVTFVCVFILIYSILFYYRPNAVMLSEPEPDYSGLHMISIVGSVVIAVIAGFASFHLSNWYLDYRNKENA